MNRYCTNVYQRMQEELRECENVNTCFDRKIECSFQVANQYWCLIKEKLKTYPFKNEEQEIQFFKTWKPRFTSEIEYFNLIYHCTLFQPPEGLEAIQFLGREYKRCETFEEENQSFIQHYKNDNWELNPYYFLRKYCACKNELETKMYDAGTDAVTNGDHLVASLLAFKRYEKFIQERVSLIDNR